MCDERAAYPGSSDGRTADECTEAPTGEKYYAASTSYYAFDGIDCTSFSFTGGCSCSDDPKGMRVWFADGCPAQSGDELRCATASTAGALIVCNPYSASTCSLEYLTIFGGSVTHYVTLLLDTAFYTTSTDTTARTVKYTFANAIEHGGHWYVPRTFSDTTSKYGGSRGWTSSHAQRGAWYQSQYTCAHPDFDVFGLVGYLPTVTSAGETAFLAAYFGGAGAGWLGGSDIGSEGTWRWIVGPEGCPGYDTSTGNADQLTRSGCNIGDQEDDAKSGSCDGTQCNQGTQFWTGAPTAAPPTPAPATPAPPTNAPPTPAPPTAAPPTNAPPTAAPPTPAPATPAPPTNAPPTNAPPTPAPPTNAPPTQAPPTPAPATPAPPTNAPPTPAPPTNAPPTQAPPTPAPATPAPPTNAPPTNAPPTPAPPTAAPPTNAPPTANAPPTQAPPTPAPATPAPPTNAPPTPAPPTVAPSTNAPSPATPPTPGPATPAPSTNAPPTPAPPTVAPPTNAPSMASPPTASPATPSPPPPSPPTQMPPASSPPSPSPRTSGPPTPVPATTTPSTYTPTAAPTVTATPAAVSATSQPARQPSPSPSEEDPDGVSGERADGSGSGGSVVWVLVVVVAAVVLCCVCCVGAWLLLRRRRRRQAGNDAGQTGEEMLAVTKDDSLNIETSPLNATATEDVLEATRTSSFSFRTLRADSKLATHQRTMSEMSAPRVDRTRSTTPTRGPRASTARGARVANPFDSSVASIAASSRDLDKDASVYSAQSLRKNKVRGDSLPPLRTTGATGAARNRAQSTKGLAGRAPSVRGVRMKKSIMGGAVLSLTPGSALNPKFQI
eukprot:TRINITY_DN3800_c0_g1_i6.p1 TRINITY_DN3800_c0_g1~~TRINITY_DN3800_c0_g1_i6.p1  ORF type:complete len:835 (+),score=36.68 TRINITY_DN3800_c0_g1_i6:585-3089(+)